MPTPRRTNVLNQHGQIEEVDPGATTDFESEVSQCYFVNDAAHLFQDIDQNLMEEHYRKNRRPRTPDPEALAMVAGRGGRKSNTVTDQHHDGSSDNDCDGNESDEIKPRRRARYANKSKADTQPTAIQLGFYPPMWRDFLDDCKIEARTYLATHNPFPQKKEAVKGFIPECINLTLEIWKGNDKKLEKNYYPKHKDDMIKLVSAQDCTGYMC
jgi:hypothetical protein